MSGHQLLFETVLGRVAELRTRVLNAIPLTTHRHCVCVYGIPRGGSIIAALLAAGSFSGLIKAVDTPSDADILVDDIEDSGATATRWHHETGLPVLSLLKRSDFSDWVVFPWEKRVEDESGVDIATRLLEFIGEDPKREGLIKTPERFIKAWKHWASGYKQSPADVLHSFADGAERCDEMVLLRSIPVWSHCEHHLAPFFGVAHVAYVPKDRIVGLSKISRLIDIFAHRLQVQERLTNQIADALQNGLEPLGVGVLLECRHTCMESRGIHQAGITTSTCALRGVFKDKPEARAEFLAGVHGV